MSPTLFFLGTLSILSAAVITNLGLPSNVWFFGVLPLFSTYILCNQQKLWQTRNLVVATVIPFSILWVRFASIHFNLWKLWIMLVWLLCYVRAFDFEKSFRYMMDTCGAIAKFLVWKVATRFIGEGERMSYKGEWANCCPYSRDIVTKKINHYFRLQPKEQVVGVITSLEDYEFNFSIESCQVLCKYTTDATTVDYTGGDTAPTSSVVSSPVKSQHSRREKVASLPLTVGVHDKVTVFSSTRSSEEESSPSKAERGRLDKISFINPPSERASSSSHVEPGETFSPKNTYTLVPSHDNKLEVSLKYEGQALESYTFFNKAPDAVMELKRVLTVLEKEGTMIFSTFNRNNGSSRSQAHASCHEFGELLNLVLNKSHMLQEVKLIGDFECIISGSFDLLSLLVLGCQLWATYYQLTAMPKISTTVVLLVLSGLFTIGVILCKDASGFARNSVKRCVHFTIDKFFPGKKDRWYKCFQVYAPWLTFGNESYGYIYTSTRENICILGDQSWALPVICRGGRNHFELNKTITEGYIRSFDLRNVNTVLTIKSQLSTF